RLFMVCFFFSSRRRHTISKRDWSSDVCSSDLPNVKIYLFQPECDLLRLELCNVAFLNFELLVFVPQSKYFLIHYTVAVYLRMFHVVLVFAFLKLGGGEQPYQYYK